MIKGNKETVGSKEKRMKINIYWWNNEDKKSDGFPLKELIFIFAVFWILLLALG